MRQIVTADLFCGGGGTSEGMKRAVQRIGAHHIAVALNHWTTAIRTHSINHPQVKHLCMSIEDVNPKEAVPGGFLDLLWASIECTYFSRARGDKPINDQRRSSGWQVLEWCKALTVNHVIIENVPEFIEWGPLMDNDRPDPTEKGKFFRAFVEELERLGYHVEWRILLCADYGDPTSRRRFFLQATKAGDKINWPVASHGSVERPHRTARECIDWSVPGKSIFRRKKPLADNTMDRIMTGLKKFCGLSFAMEHTGPQSDHGRRVKSLDDPLPTVTSKGMWGLVEPKPFLVNYYGTGGATSVDDPLDTVTTHDRFGLVEPHFLPKVVDEQGNHIGYLDILFRMLQPRELARAQGFPDEYIFHGNKEDMVAQIGNAVPVYTSEALCYTALAQ